MCLLYQIVSAVQIAFDQNPATHQNLKRQAFDYVNQLRTEPSAWQPCLNIFTKIPRYHDVVRFFALEIVNKAVEGGTLDEQATNTVKEQLMTYLERSYKTAEGLSQRDENSLENKIAQTITFLFSTRYPSGWESIFDNLLSLTSDDQSGRYDRAEGTVFYLRVVNSIHDEIGDQSLARTGPEQDRANLLKDLIRERDVQKIAQSWQDILAHWGESNDMIAELTLKAIGKWVSWIDISLVVNQRMLELLFQQLARAQKLNLRPHEEKARDAAIDVFTEITGKKMKTSDKLEMIGFLDLDRVVTQLIACPPLSERRGSSQYDTDLAETVAKLVNVTVLEIVRALETDSGNLQMWQRAEAMLQAFLPHVLRFFADEYDEVCSTVIPSLNDVLSFLRKSAKDGLSSPQRTVMLLPILRAVFAKMRYDETASWGEDDDEEDEAEFQDLRKRLDVLQQSIAGADEQLYSDAVTGIVEQTFDDLRAQGAQLNWRDLELALHEMFLFGDLAVKTGGLYQKNKPNSTAAEKLVQMMLKMMESDIASFDHPATQLHYMNICVRYSSFFEKHTRYITTVLENFLKLVHHPVMKVKTKSWYLFQRYVRLLRTHVGPLAETVIQNLSDLLTIKAEAPTEANGDDMSSEDLDSSADTIFTSQLYLFEAVGSICGANSVSINKQTQLCQSVMLPIFSDMEQTLPAAGPSDERAVLQIHHDIMALGTLARGFSDWASISALSNNPPAPEVQAVFGRVAEATLVALESLKSSFIIRTAARFAFSRLIGVLGAQILPQLPRWIDGLLTQSSTNDEVALFLRLLDQVIFAFKGDIYGFLDSLFTGLLRRVFSGLNNETTGTDDEIQLAELKREYLNFLLVILNNDLGSVIVSGTNQPFFNTVVGTIEHFTKDEEDYPTAKMAFQVLVKMCSTWGGPDVIPTAGRTNDSTPVSQPALPGLDHFMITRLSPLCWALPATESFNPHDAQARLVLGEAANLQKIIYSKTGQEYLSWLRDNELRSMGMNDDMINEYLSKMTGLDTRAFRAYFQAFVGEAGGR